MGCIALGLMLLVEFRVVLWIRGSRFALTLNPATPSREPPTLSRSACSRSSHFSAGGRVPEAAEALLCQSTGLLDLI